MDRVHRKLAPRMRIGGKYQLVRPLGEGGMGTVWVAHHVDLDIQVALKLVRADIDAPDASARLIREAKAAARLDHPAIVRVLDVGMHEGRDPYLVMELLGGETLADVLDREGRVDAVAAVRIVLPILSAVDAIHRAGMLHRDIKPENVLLARDDAGRLQPKLVDFGLAKMSTSAGSGRITAHGAVVGTPVYLSLERLLGADASPQDDLWAVCVMLYALVAGELPFDDHAGLEGLLDALLHPTRPLPLRGSADAQLGAILHRALGPLEGRFASARALGKALAAWAWSHGITHDITETALRPDWLDDDEVRLLSSGSGGSSVPTRRFAWTPLSPTQPRDPDLVTLEEQRTLDAPVVISQRPPPMRAPAGPRWLGLSLLTFGLAASISFVVRSGSVVRPAAGPAASSVAPELAAQAVAVADTAPIVATGAPEPTASVRPPDPPPRAARPPAPRRMPPPQPAPRPYAEIEIKNPYR